MPCHITKQGVIMSSWKNGRWRGTRFGEDLSLNGRLREYNNPNVHKLVRVGSCRRRFVGAVAGGKGRPGLTAARLWGCGAGQATLGPHKAPEARPHPHAPLVPVTSIKTNPPIPLSPIQPSRRMQVNRLKKRKRDPYLVMPARSRARYKIKSSILVDPRPTRGTVDT